MHDISDNKLGHFQKILSSLPLTGYPVRSHYSRQRHPLISYLGELSRVQLATSTTHKSRKAVGWVPGEYASRMQHSLRLRVCHLWEKRTKRVNTRARRASSCWGSSAPMAVGARATR